MSNNPTLIPSVNFHLWEPCNFRCKFCFASFQDVKESILPKGHLPKDDTIEVVRQLCRYGFSKITFVGGEPTLCPWLPELIAKAKSFGVTTMIVTNGSRITADYLIPLKGILDWITLSVDSLNPEINRMTGRGNNQILFSMQDYLEKCRIIKEAGFRLKINTVVHRLNCNEVLSSLLAKALPERWKIFKVLPVSGQNSAGIPELDITDAEFRHFLEINGNLQQDIEIVPESNDAMTGSYLMIDPAGRFFDNTKGFYTYSEPILKAGVERSLIGINQDYDRFIKRKGLYEWDKSAELTGSL
ncbi:MAG: viperin family antiviral radical SAM protein [Bacteroidia bacterium]